MVALSGAAGVVLDGLLRRGAAHTRGGSAGLHMPGAASFAKTASMVARASGVRYPVIGAHAVKVLFADGDAAPAGAVVVGEVAVGVEAVGELVGQLGSARRGDAGCLAGPAAPRPVGGSRRRRSRAAGARNRGSPSHGRLRFAGPLRLGGGGQHRRQRLAGERAARPDRRPHECAETLRRG